MLIVLLNAGNFTKWEEFVRDGIYHWKTMLRNWVVLPHMGNTVAKHPLLIIKYEDLKREPEVGLKRMLDFLKADYSVGNLSHAVSSQALRLFQRAPERKSNSLSHFTATQHELVEKSLRDISRLLSNRGLQSVLSVDDYLEVQ